MPTQSDRRVCCAVVGAGWWGTWAHVPALANHPRAELIAVQHHDPSKAARIAADFGVPHACTSAEQVWELDGLEAVVISSTPQLHFPQAKAALEHGLHVLVEKPMTHTVAQSRELVALAEQKDLQLLVGCTFHYNQHAQEARRLIQSGAVGEVKMILATFMDEIFGLYQGVSWREFAAAHPDPEVDASPYLTPGRESYSDPRIAGGGQLFTQVSHPAALLTYLTGEHPVEVHALLDNADTAVDVYDALSVKLSGGTIVSLCSGGRIGTGPRHLDIRVYGTRGVLEMELLQGTLQLWEFAGETRSYPQLASDLDLYPRYEPANNLIDAVLGLAHNRSPGTLGLAALQILEGAVRAAETGQAVRWE